MSSGDDDNVDGYGRVLIGELSQGCATAVFCLLGGFPSSEKEIAGLLKTGGSEAEEEDDEDDEDPFAHGTDEENSDVPLPMQAVNHVRDILNMHPIQSPDGDKNDSNHQNALHLKTPVFLGYGGADSRVSVELGLRMVNILSGENGLKMDVTLNAYEEFRHWYKVLDEIDDVVKFWRRKLG